MPLALRWTPQATPTLREKPQGNFPTTPGAFQTTGGYSAFVTKLNPTGTGLVYSTLLGATGNADFAIAVDTSGNAYVTGSTSSTAFPTTAGAFQTTKNGISRGRVRNETQSHRHRPRITPRILGAPVADLSWGIAVDTIR